MRLADFVLEHTESILVEWEAFARSIWPGEMGDSLALRDHAKDILRATALDMKSAQTAEQQSDKSKGDGDDGKDSARVDGASDVHAIARVSSGFDLLTLVAEYRALRASVIRLWRESAPDPDRRDLADITRFNESIDQSLTEAIRSYTQRVDRSRQMFLAILSHDLRSPLNAISLFANVLTGDPHLTPADTAEVGGRIRASADAMSGMIADLFDFTRSGVGATMPVVPLAMDLKPVCEEVIREIRAAYPSRTLRFHPDGDLTGEWDSGRVRQLFSNLLGNAVQHGTPHGPVDLFARGEGSNVVVTVRNDGTPIPADILPTIFDPLVRGASSEQDKRRRPGSIGLGLYIAREVARAHGGDIQVKSSEEGTLFTVDLPRLSKKKAPAENTAASSLQGAAQVG